MGNPPVSILNSMTVALKRTAARANSTYMYPSQHPADFRRFIKPSNNNAEDRMKSHQCTLFGKAVPGKISEEQLDHYRKFSAFTYPGSYQSFIKDELPDDVREVGRLLRAQIVHRVTLARGNSGSNSDLRYGDMRQIPWWRQPEDDNFPTAAALLAELFRRDKQGFNPERKVENKLIVTCRFVAILMAAILKSKGIRAKGLSGYDSYASPKRGKSCDHWITQYWESKQ